MSSSSSTRSGARGGNHFVNFGLSRCAGGTFGIFMPLDFVLAGFRLVFGAAPGLLALFSGNRVGPLVLPRTLAGAPPGMCCFFMAETLP